MAQNEGVQIIRTTCPAHCGIDACGILAHVKDGKVIKLEPADFPNPKYKRICLRGLSALEITYHPDRLKYPLKRVGERGEGKFERISWDEALDTIAEKFKAVADEHGWRAIGWTCGGPGAGTTKFGAYLRLASLTQSTRVSAWGYGDAGLPCGSRTIFGTHIPYALLAGGLMSGHNDSELIVVWGSNPAEAQPLIMMRPIMDAKAEGATLVVVDPRFTVTASKADQYIGIKPGTDAALALGMLNVIFNEGLEDTGFILKHTVGPYLVRADTGQYLRGKDIGLAEENEYVVWDTVSDSPKLRTDENIKPSDKGAREINGISCKTALQLLMDLAEEYPPPKVAEITGVDSDLIVNFARRVGQAESVTFVTHMGLTRTYHGDISIRGLSSVAAVTGNIRATVRAGHRPAVLNWKPFLHTDTSRPSYSRLGILQLYDAVISGKPFPIKAVWFSFVNFVNQCANTGKIINEMFPKLDMIVTAELFMTPTAKYADIVLPTTTFLEFSDFIPHPHPYVQLQRKVIEPLHECRSDVDIASGLAERLGYGEYFQGGEDGFIDIIVDMKDGGLKDVTREALTKGPIALAELPDLGDGVDIPFSTPSGKIELYSERLVEDGQALPVYLEPLESPVKPEGKKYPLSFVQGHSRFRTHSMFSNVQSLLDMNPEPLVEINPVDAASRDIEDNDMVTVFNSRARTTLKARISDSVQPGMINIMQGWWLNQFVEGSVNHLTHDVINPVQEKVYEPNMHMNDVAVDVVKYEERGW